MALFDKKKTDSPAAAAGPQLDTLKQKYQSVLNRAPQLGARLQNVHVENGKLVIRAEVPSEQAKNELWDQIKLVNPSWSSDLVADITVRPGQGGPQGGSASVGARTHTVQAGDTLSALSKRFYGDGNQYMKIFDANRDKLKDPDRIQVGQVLNIPS
jgi:nucleoid-associated protein YgaU